MLFLALLTYFFLVAVVFAIPSSRERFEQRQASRSKNGRRGMPLHANVTHSVQSTNWAGSVISAEAGTWKEVTGTFIVPTPPKPVDSTGLHAASVWVGIDGATCQTAIFQTGIDIYVNGTTGAVSYDAWNEWWPYNAEDYGDMTISAGDLITISVFTWFNNDYQHAAALITNNDNGQVQSVLYSDFPTLCGQDAEWIVEDFEMNGEQVPFANFGTVKFTSALAYTNWGGVSWPTEGVPWNIVQNGETLTSVTSLGSTVTISHF